MILIQVLKQLSKIIYTLTYICHRATYYDITRSLFFKRNRVKWYRSLFNARSTINRCRQWIGHFDEPLRNCDGKILFAGTMLSKSILKRESRKKAIAREEVESTNRVINVHTFSLRSAMCRVCARTTRKSRDTSRAAFIWRVKTFGQPYHITLSTKSSGVPPTSRNNKFLTFSALGALSFFLWGTAQSPYDRAYTRR